MESDYFKILLALKAKRLEIASLKKVEAFKIFHNATLEEIAKLKPQTLEDLAKIKGLGGSKLSRYGVTILEIVRKYGTSDSLSESALSEVEPHSGRLALKYSKNREISEVEPQNERGSTSLSSRKRALPKVEPWGLQGSTLKTLKPDALSVSEFLDLINGFFSTKNYSIQGELTEFKISGRSIFFSLKDKKDSSLLNCYISQWAYESLGITLEDGMEVLVGGNPSIYKPYGKFSFQATSIEPIGEGALRKAYELLKKKLEIEGLFARKRELPEFIERIGVISSKSGVVIHDFMKNLKPRGFEISFYDARVEGPEAVGNIVSGINSLNKKNIDVIVIIRGGGSLESLQAFNNERVARAIFGSPIPTICGIGHDVDVPIACLVGDLSVSTPTATAHAVSRSWARLEEGLPMINHRLMNSFESALVDKLNLVDNFYNKATGIVRQLSVRIQRSTEDLVNSFKRIMENTTQTVSHAEKILAALNPENQLRLGYSILFDSAGKVLKNIDSIEIGDMIKARLQKGSVSASIKEKHKE